MIAQPPNTVFILAGGMGSEAEAAWRYLRAESVPNLYILDGGVDAWLEQFMPADSGALLPGQALGSRHPAADPNPRLFTGTFEPKVKMEIKRAPAGGGCG
jgi:hypothetical protein